MNTHREMRQCVTPRQNRVTHPLTCTKTPTGAPVTHSVRHKITRKPLTCGNAAASGASPSGRAHAPTHARVGARAAATTLDEPPTRRCKMTTPPASNTHQPGECPQCAAPPGIHAAFCETAVSRLLDCIDQRHAFTNNAAPGGKPLWECERCGEPRITPTDTPAIAATGLLYGRAHKGAA